MATGPHRRRIRKVDYPTGDGKPMAETDIHRNDMIDLLLLGNTSSPAIR